MINELYRLACALDAAGIKVKPWHRKYLPIPKVTQKTPCVHVYTDGTRVKRLSRLSAEDGACIRKFGSLQGSFPAMNLTPLYRVPDDAAGKAIARLLEHPEEVDAEAVKRLCTETNWDKKLCRKYKICMEATPAELFKALEGTAFEATEALDALAKAFPEAEALHTAMRDAAFRMLERKTDVRLALQVLFLAGTGEAARNLSIVLDSVELEKLKLSTATAAFTDALNGALLQAQEKTLRESEADNVDAFGVPFKEKSEPMPSVRLAGGFDVTLRTMFSEKACQFRYGRADDATYPISPRMRETLQGALAWVSAKERKDITWARIDKDELLFVYPESQPQAPVSGVAVFQAVKGMEAAKFTARTSAFLEKLRDGAGSERKSTGIQIMVLRKLDKARSKVVYTYRTDAAELERRSAAWDRGVKNLPQFDFGVPEAPLPMEAATILNRVWRQDGRPIAGKCTAFKRYHGLRVLFEPDGLLREALRGLSARSTALAPMLGNLRRTRFALKNDEVLCRQVLEILAMMGILLHGQDIKKGEFMKNLAYQLGQLLKVSDELHLMYCRVVRDGDIPPHLAGSELYMEAAQAPYHALGQLGQRMHPYITWARPYSAKNVETAGRESRLVGYYLSIFEACSTLLHEAWDAETAFGEAEKAELFIGYMAAFPKAKPAEQKEEMKDAK